ncbi:hypothetical protein QVH35_04290 [Candidatus Nitrosotenuis chungbukensis]|uniref:hypothetical protein n=1 Tax=Candidatus Nitrosotenuis chungbukensis TaxID=1353246 RepID=UPI00069449DC|nr:hypothetical protein [Candidatus Nitrosotenuis chungbukensis]WKT58603.1 hypothetical protein QVH35_04290 [Candidatus Nitrosotenuis chungbukensis]
MKSHFALLLIFVLGFGFYSAYAHKTVTVEQYVIEVGWKEEPPLVGIQNAITFEFSQDEGGGVTTPIANSFRDLESTVKSGSLTKTLEILSDAKPGNYYAKIIPTKTGSLIIGLKGTLNGVPINQEIQIEDVGSTDILAFPPSSSSGQDVGALKNAMSSLQKDVTEIKSKIGNVAGGNGIDLSKAYDFGVFGLALGAAGVILAVVAMVKRK